MNKRISATNKLGPLDNNNNDDLFQLSIPITWDGSYLGSIDNSHIKCKFKLHGKDIWQLSFIPGNVMYSSAINFLPCINDEMLKLFNMNSIGTHSVSYNNIIYILYKLEEYDNLLEGNEHLVSSNCLSDIQKIITMKFKMGWSKFDEKDILLRWNSKINDYIAVPIHENTIGNFKGIFITQKLYRKYMHDHNTSSVISDQKEDIIFLQLLTNVGNINSQGRNDSSLIGECFSLISKIELCIEKLEPDLIFIINEIRKNIMLAC